MNFDIDIAIVALYLIITLVVGIWKGRNIKSMKEYAVADRNYPIPILVATIAATEYGGGSTIGVIEKSYIYGVVVIAITMLNFFPKIFLGRYIAPKMQYFKNAISAGDIMENLYGKSAKIITGVAGLGLSMGYIGAQIAALGYVLNSFFGIDPVIGIYVSAGVVIIYSAFGGIKSVTATDIIQFAAIVVVIPIMSSIALTKAGGFQGIIDNIEPSKLALFPDHISIYDIAFTALVYITPFLNPAMIQRLLLAKNSKDMSESFTISAFLDVAFYFMVGVIGLSAFVLNSNLNPGDAFFYIINETLPIGIKGMAIVGLLAVIMSTADSYLNVASISLVHDIVTPFNRNLTDKVLLNLSKLISVIIGIGGIILATSHNSILEIANTTLDFWGPIIVAPLILGILGFRASSRTFFVSGAIAIISYFFLKDISSSNVLGVSAALVPSMFINAFVFLTLYYLFDRKNNSGDDDTPDGGGSGKDKLEDSQSDQEPEKGLLSALKDETLSLLSRPLSQFSAEKTGFYGAQYVGFGVFGIVSYTMPFFMITPTTYDSFVSMAVRFIAVLLCFFLVIKDYWPRKLKKYLPIYWHVTLIYCLPFYSIISIFMNGLTMPTLINLSLALFLLAILTDWFSFMVLLVVGVMASIIGHLFLTHQVDVDVITTNKDFLWLVYTFIFSVSLGAIFARKKEDIHKQTLGLLTEKVAEKTKYLESALQAKKNFLNNMSHEIRTPLHGILAISNGLQEHWKILSEEERISLNDKVVSNSDRLMNLVSNLLDMSKLESGKMGFNIKKNDLKIVIKSVIDEFNTSLNDFEISLDVEKNTKLSLLFDSERISQVVRNLLSNAIKFGNNKDIEIKIENCKYSTKGKNNISGVKISVVDYGIGIPAAEIDNIFNAFVESSKTKTRAGGTGLGLSISKEIVLAHNGIIYAETKENKSIFSFILPTKIQYNTTSVRPLTILLIDDEEVCLTSCSLILSSLGHKVILASGGVEALSILKQGSEKIDLILLDLMMPDIYGINVLKEIKHNIDLSKIPVIIQSGISDAQEIKRSYNLGAIDFIPKPYLKDKVANTIARLH